MMTTETKFTGKNYSIELVDGMFVLDTPATDTERFDSFEELSEAHPVCEEAREFFFGEPMGVAKAEAAQSRTDGILPLPGGLDI